MKEPHKYHNSLKFIFILVLLPLLFGTSCKKDCNPTPYFPLDQDFLSYFAFPVGSWWVYEEVSSGQRDSCYVILNETEVDEMHLGRRDGCGLSYKYEKLYLNEVILSDTVYGMALPIASEELDYYVFRQNWGQSFFKIINSDIGMDTLTGKIYISAYYETLTIRTTLYNEVIVISHPVFPQQRHLKDTYYSKNVGVVRRDFTDGTQWELVKYHINQ